MSTIRLSTPRGTPQLSQLLLGVRSELRGNTRVLQIRYCSLDFETSIQKARNSVGKLRQLDPLNRFLQWELVNMSRIAQSSDSGMGLPGSHVKRFIARQTICELHPRLTDQW